MRLYFPSLLLVLVCCACSGKATDTTTEEPTTDTTTVVENNKATSAEEKIAPDLTIYPNQFYGIKLWDKISQHSKILEKTVLRSGEGEFDVYNILDKQGTAIGYIIPHWEKEDQVGDIVVTTQQAKTLEGVAVGMSYQEIAELIDDFTVNGSEVEGRVHLRYGNYHVRLDINSWETELDKSEIPPATKALSIWVYEPYSPAGTGAATKSGGYYICYKSDDGASRNLAAFFTADGEVQNVMYEGQNKAIKLNPLQSESHATAYVTETQTYEEIINGKPNGTYEFTKSGNWYYVAYITRDGKNTYKFTYLPEQSFSTTGCF